MAWSPAKCGDHTMAPRGPRRQYEESPSEKKAKHNFCLSDLASLVHGVLPLSRMPGEKLKTHEE